MVGEKKNDESWSRWNWNPEKKGKTEGGLTKKKSCRKKGQYQEKLKRGRPKTRISITLGGTLRRKGDYEQCELIEGSISGRKHLLDGHRRRRGKNTWGE